MTIKKTGKIWLGVGAATVIGIGGSTGSQSAAPSRDTPASPRAQLIAQAQAEAAQPGSEHAAHAAPAEVAPKTASQGGEGGEGAADGLDPRIKFFRDMGLIRGHLYVGHELVKAGLWAEALPHFHHPIEELYPSVGAKLKLQNIRQFDGALKALAQTVQAKNAAAYANALKVVQQRMNDADKGMKRFASPFPQSPVKTIIAMLQSAASEYGEGIENGKFAKPIEYQDARGFVFHAETLLDVMAKDLEKIDKPAVGAMRAAFVELKKAWPAPVPPDAPVKDQAQVLADVSRVELAASPFLKD